jgi:glycosyltransferase involved in cell wall biosynthesis
VSDQPRVLFVVRPDASTRFGGDTQLARDTFDAVRELGVNADFVESDRPDPRGYDLAHVFNVGQPDVCKRQLDACDAAGVPVALSPVWLDLREFFGRAAAYERLFFRARSTAAVDSALGRYRKRSIDSFLNRRQARDLDKRLREQSALLERAQVLLPNSAIEARDCLVQLGVRDKPLVIAPIPATFEPAAYWQSERGGLMAIGRIETRKNQSGLLYAVREEPYQIDLVGAVYHEDLARACQRWCPRARFHGRLPRERMLEMLGHAQVHALVSWCETAGIASMEAAAAGANIVVGDRGAEVEYFGDDAEYADPADPDSIRAAIRRAFARPPRRPGDSLDERIRTITARRAGEQTVRAYHLALANRSPMIA